MLCGERKEKITHGRLLVALTGVVIRCGRRRMDFWLFATVLHTVYSHVRFLTSPQKKKRVFSIIIFKITDSMRLLYLK